MPETGQLLQYGPATGEFHSDLSELLCCGLNRSPCARAHLSEQVDVPGQFCRLEGDKDMLMSRHRTAGSNVAWFVDIAEVRLLLRQLGWLNLLLVLVWLGPQPQRQPLEVWPAVVAAVAPAEASPGFA